MGRDVLELGFRQSCQPADPMGADAVLVTRKSGEVPRLHFEPGGSGLLGVSQAGDDPATSASLKSSMTFAAGVTFDADFRHVDAFPDPAVRTYWEYCKRGVAEYASGNTMVLGRMDQTGIDARSLSA